MGYFSHTKDRLFAAAVQIQHAPFDSEIAFTARELVQATLPHRDPGEVPAWQRTNGNYALVIQPGWDSKAKKSIGCPYGTIPRLLLFWMTTEVLRTGNRRLEMGNTLASFMRQLGLNPENGSAGAKRSDARRLRDQIKRLFNARISFQYSDEHNDRWLSMEIAPQGELWWNEHNAAQLALWGSWIELGENSTKP
jgi:hypothetical protein